MNMKHDFMILMMIWPHFMANLCRNVKLRSYRRRHRIRCRHFSMQSIWWKKFQTPHLLSISTGTLQMMSSSMSHYGSTAKAKCFKTNSWEMALFLGNSTQLAMVSDHTRENSINKNDYITCNQVNPLLCVELWSIQPLCGKIWMVIISTRQESRRKQEEELRRGAPLLCWLVGADDTSCSEGISYCSSVSSLNVTHKTGHADVNSTVSIVQLTL